MSLTSFGGFSASGAGTTKQETSGRHFRLPEVFVFSAREAR